MRKIFQVPGESKHFNNDQSIEQGHLEAELNERALAEMTAQIVAAYLSRNTVPTAEVPRVIAAVRQGLAAMGVRRDEERGEKPEPAVPVKGSVSRDAIACLICGRRQKMLKRHLLIAHGLSPVQYRQSFNLRSDYPMTAPSYAKKRSQLARQFGLGVRAKSR